MLMERHCILSESAEDIFTDNKSRSEVGKDLYYVGTELSLRCTQSTREAISRDDQNSNPSGNNEPLCKDRDVVRCQCSRIVTRPIGVSCAEMFQPTNLNPRISLVPKPSKHTHGEEAILLAHHSLRLFLLPNDSRCYDCLYTGKSYR